MNTLVELEKKIEPLARERGYRCGFEMLCAYGVYPAAHCVPKKFGRLRFAGLVLAAKLKKRL